MESFEEIVQRNRSSSFGRISLLYQFIVELRPDRVGRVPPRGHVKIAACMVACRRYPPVLSVNHWITRIVLTILVIG